MSLRCGTQKDGFGTRAGPAGATTVVETYRCGHGGQGWPNAAPQEPARAGRGYRAATFAYGLA
jgi:hypothetical protein